jgi:hypothetical protein
VGTGKEVAFEEENGGARVTIVQRGFPVAELRDEFLDGWRGIPGAFRRVVATGIS